VVFRILVAGAILSASAWAGDGPQFALRDTNNVIHSSGEWNGKRAVVAFFTTTDCPLSNGDVPEMNRIRHSYEDRGVAFYAVQADTTITETEVVAHAKAFQFSFAVLLDPKQVLVKLTGATIIPEAAVLSSAGNLLYLGRIDNRVEGFDTQRPQATQFDLRDALDAVLAGKPAPHPRTKAFGCAINTAK